MATDIGRDIDYFTSDELGNVDRVLRTALRRRFSSIRFEENATISSEGVDGRPYIRMDKENVVDFVLEMRRLGRIDVSEGDGAEVFGTWDCGFAPGSPTDFGFRRVYLDDLRRFVANQMYVERTTRI